MLMNNPCETFMCEYEAFMSEFYGFTSFGLEPQPVVWLTLYAIVLVIYYVATMKRREKWIDKKMVVHVFFIFYIISVLRFTFTPLEIWGAEYRFYFMRAFMDREPFTFWEIVSAVDLVPLRSIIFTLRSTVHWPLILRAIGGNIIILLPFSIFLGLLSEKEYALKKVALTVFLVSLSIETLQLGVNLLTGWHNRLVLVDDLILNTLGAVLGYFIFKKFGHLFDAIVTRIYKFLIA
ncbi:MAG: VanZ family protein [Defluviitaleaceae bacterium]|nr:VanZ family protein [Defluviitaleaceae bacterium]